MRIKLGHLRQIIREAVGSHLDRRYVSDKIDKYKSAVAAYKNVVGDAAALAAAGPMTELEAELIALRDAAESDFRRGYRREMARQIVMDINSALSGEEPTVSGPRMTDPQTIAANPEFFRRVLDPATRPFRPR